MHIELVLIVSVWETNIPLFPLVWWSASSARVLVTSSSLEVIFVTSIERITCIPLWSLKTLCWEALVVTLENYNYLFAVKTTVFVALRNNITLVICISAIYVNNIILISLIFYLFLLEWVVKSAASWEAALRGGLARFFGLHMHGVTKRYLCRCQNSFLLSSS